MALQGTYQDFGLPDIFQLISLQRKTGVLTIRSEREAIRIVFFEGHIVEADSEPRRFEDRLGQVLVRTGILTEEQLNQALEKQKRTLQRLGFVLLETKLLDEKTLKQALETQISQTVYRTFRWKSGTYMFEPQNDIQYDPRIDVMLSTDNVLMEGIQIVDEWPVIQRRIPDFNMVFRPLVDPDTIHIESASEALDFSFGLDTEKPSNTPAPQGVTLSADEFKVYTLIDGRRTIQEILDRVALPEFPTIKIIYDFYVRGLIEPVRATQQLTEVVVEPAAQEKITSATILGVLTSGFGILFLLLIILSLFDPLRPYSVPSQQPAYGIYVKNCSQWTRYEEIGYFLLHQAWSTNLESINNEPIIRRCFMDPKGRPAQVQVADDKVTIQYLDPKGKTIESVQLERPFIDIEILGDPLEDIQIRPNPNP